VLGQGHWIAAAVVLNKKLYGLRDSKLLSTKDRENLSRKISKLVFGESERFRRGVEIDKIGISKANQLAFSRAIEKIESARFYFI